MPIDMHNSGITALTGDVTATGSGSVAATLKTVNSAPGTTGDDAHVSQITTDANGRVTANSNVAIAPSAIGAEPALGNPATNGSLLSSTSTGTRSWIDPATLKETLGQRLRRLADVAGNNNPWSGHKGYMKAVQPWQPSTAYGVGACVVNGGYIYVGVYNSGTSATSGGPTQTNNNGVQDGSMYWTFFGTNNVTTDPTLTQPAWTQSTAYSLGQQVINGGLVFACVVAGTSAATGNGPTGTYGSNSVSDGTVTWTYLGHYMPNQYAQDFPTVTTSSSTTSGNSYFPAYGILSINRARPVAGGSGYALGDTITITAGTHSVAGVLSVTGVSAGAVTSVSVTTPGVYTTLGTNVATPQGSTSGSGTGATFNIAYSALNFGGAPAWGRLSGAYVAANFSNQYAYTLTFQPAPNTASLTGHWSLEFYTDCPNPCINFNSARGTAVIIDGVRYSLDTQNTLASNTYWQFDFRATSGRKKRLFHIDFVSGNTIPGISVDANSMVWPPDNNDVITAALISDSIWTGSSWGPFLGGNSVAHRLGHELGWKNVWDYSQGGTGYTDAGGEPSPGGVYQYRIAEALAQNPNIWVLMGSTNDSAGSVGAAVAATLSAIRSVSSAPIVVAGVWSISGATSIEAAVQTAVQSYVDPLGLTFWVPICYDPLCPWITGSWNNNPTPSGYNWGGSTNAGLYVVNRDNVHPTDSGTEYLALRLANAIRNDVLPKLP